MIRRIWAALASLVLLAVTAPAALGGPASKGEFHAFELQCDLHVHDGSGASLQLGVTVVDDGSFGADALIWFGDPFETEPDLFGTGEGTASRVGSTVTASIPMADAAGDPAGTLEVAATVTPTGEVFDFEPFRDGNRWIKTTGQTVVLAVDGSATIGSRSWSLDGCFAGDTDLAIFETNPHSYVTSFEETSGFCTVTGSAGTPAFIDVFVEGTEVGLVFALLDGATDDITRLFFGTLPDATGGSTALEELDLDTGEPIGGSVDATLDLSRIGESFAYVTESYFNVTRVQGEVIDVEGDIGPLAGETWSLDACVVTESSSKVHSNAPNGPKPSGKAPANDLPAKAATIRVGGQASAITKGAAIDAEATTGCLTVDDQLVRTVWYKVTGTGGTLTVDTAGSDFDTVVAVYAGSPTASAEVACNDDRDLEPFGFTRQAATSWSSVAGQTYYIQVGGYPGIDAITGSFGQLRVTVRAG